jgi:Tol biopolymer transport system component/DNA-binding winged helix-turn-helix (wHTH) protein
MTRNESNRARFGPYEVDLHTHELWKFGTRIKLVGQPFEILAMLLGHPGELVTRDEMRRRLWPSDTFVDFNHGLNAAVNRLREALSDSAEGPRYIETLPRRGYRFIGQVEWLDAQSPVSVFLRNPASIPPSESQPAPEFTLEPELPIESAPAHGVWHQYLIGAGLLCTVLIAVAFFFRPVPPFGKVSTAHDIVEHTRPLVEISDTSCPALSPDGNSIAFFRRHSDDEGSGIYMSTLGGDQPLQLARDERNGCPVWSPDGHFIAFTRRVGDSYSIHVIASDGGASKKRNAEASVETRSASFLITSSASPDQEISTGGIPLTHGELDWSPDGKFIAFAGPDGIYLVSRTDFTVHRLTQAPKSTQDWGPAFVPDGKKVLFVRDNQLDSSNELRSVSIGGGDWTRIFFERGKITSPPQWSYDGRSVIFSSNRTGHPALWRISLDSPTEAIQVSEAGAPAWDPAVSRRGYRLAYERPLRSLSIWQMDLTASDKAPTWLCLPQAIPIRDLDRNSLPMVRNWLTCPTALAPWKSGSRTATAAMHFY